MPAWKDKDHPVRSDTWYFTLSLTWSPKAPVAFPSRFAILRVLPQRKVAIGLLLRWPKHLSLATFPQKFPETDFAIVPSCTERTPASWSFLIAITSATHGRTAKEKVSTTAVAFTYGIRR